MKVQPPFSILFLLIALPLLFMLFGLIFVGAISMAFQKLGFSPILAIFLLFAVLFGSFINVPVWKIKGMQERYTYDMSSFLPKQVKTISEGTTRVDINIGGAIIPLVVSIFLLSRLAVKLYPHLMFATIFMAAICYKLARPVQRTGIAMPAFIPPVLASLAGVILAPQNAAVVAFISGVVGVLVGADLMNIRKIGRIGAPAVSIGGAGTFDGIFLTGILSVMLVAIV
ncbi:MAG: DUF1614 domain-containing protein [Candidatus Thermoplasmatota archaeon]|nr:DUF1614 domain-containing protein [Candidatus Thermoplasmatota archaeon]